MAARSRLPWIALASLLGAVAALLLAPRLHALFADLGWAARSGPEGREAFLKVVRRGLMVGAGLPFALALRPWREVPPSAMGFVGPRARPAVGAVACAATLATGVLLLAAQGAAGWWEVLQPLPVGRAWAHTARVFLVPALLVAIFEEMLFRGWLEGRHAAAGRPWRTAAGVSAFYALLHAFRARPRLLDVDMDVGGALEALRTWAGRTLEPSVFGPTFVGLFLFGLVLSGTYRRSGTIWASIGVHAAGITLLQAQEAWIVRTPSPAWGGTGRLLDGLPGMAVLVAALAWLVARPGPARADQGRSTSSGSTPGP